MDKQASDPEQDEAVPTQSLERELEHIILAGEIRPGERLHEIQLSKRFGISRGPLREATRSLQSRGMVQVIPKRGVFVRSVSPEEFLLFDDVRSGVFGLAGRILADRVDDAMLATMRDYLDQMDIAAEQRDFDEYYRQNLAFHDFLLSGTGNETLIEVYKTLANKLHLCRARSLVDAGGLSVSNHEHREMVEAVATGNRDRAQAAFFRHVERARDRFKSTIEAAV